MSTIKYNRTKALSVIGENHGSFDAMWAHLPAEIIEALSSTKLAKMVDSLWSCAGQSKAIAEREACENGFLWDARAHLSRDLAA